MSITRLEDARALKQIGADRGAHLHYGMQQTLVSCDEGPRRFHGRGEEWKTGRNNRQNGGR